MELFIQRDDFAVDVLLAYGFLLASLGVVLSLATALVGQHEELCDLVGVLARCRYFDWAGPVEIEVTECKRQRLNFQLRQVRVVFGNVEMSRQHTALSCVGGGQEEIKDTLAFSAIVFNETLVDDAA